MHSNCLFFVSNDFKNCLEITVSYYESISLSHYYHYKYYFTKICVTFQNTVNYLNTKQKQKPQSQKTSVNKVNMKDDGMSTFLFLNK